VKSPGFSRCWCCAEPRAPRSVPPLVKGGERGLVAGWRGAEANKSPQPPFEKGGEEGVKSPGFSRCWCCAEPRAPRSLPPLVKGGEGGLVVGWRGAEAKKSPLAPL